MATRRKALDPTSPTLERVLAILARHTGHDLSQYKPSTIERRIERRLAIHRLTTISAYADLLERTPEEGALLLRELLIGVTQFFRDEDMFALLRDRTLPAHFLGHAAPHVVRCWVAGCSTGEEAYSLAIVLHEVLAQIPDHPGFQIYATDLDEASILSARSGFYPAAIAKQMSSARLARYFTREDGSYRVRTEIRERIVFAQHDLIADPPFTRIDLVFCRNVMIYLQPVLQQQLMWRFHYALAAGGLLVVGGSETAPPNMFSPLTPTSKVFRRIEVPPGSARRMLHVAGIRATAAALPPETELTVVEAARRAILETIAPPTLLVNERGDVLYTTQRTSRYLELAVGKTNINVHAMARGGLGAHLSIAIRQAISKRRRVTTLGVVVRAERGSHAVDITVVPLDAPNSLRGLLLVSLSDSPEKRARGGKASPRSALARELAQTKLQLEAAVRDMEASHAMLEATNEELQSANEELQSVNEEVTTSKEELQSMNEELVVLNGQMLANNSKLSTENDDLSQLLDSMRIPTLFLDAALRIMRFSSDATRIANLRASDMGRAITDITLKVEGANLARDVKTVLETLTSTERIVTGPKRSRFVMRIHPRLSATKRVEGVVITFIEPSKGTA